MKTPSGLQPLIDDGVIDEVMRPLKRVQYQEGRKVRGSREARAIGKASKYGRKQQEAAWKNTEVDALYQLRDAGVRVPEPFGYFHGVLVMELVVDADGHSAPRLGEVELSPEQARGFHRFLVRQVIRMLCVGLIHGDLSEYNVLVAPDGGWAPELLEPWYGEEMWALFEAGELHPDSELTGAFVHDESTPDIDGVRHAINDAREEALIRQQGREAAAQDD